MSWGSRSGLPRAAVRAALTHHHQLQRLKAAGSALSAWAAFHQEPPPSSPDFQRSLLLSPCLHETPLYATPTSCSVVLSPTAIWVLFLPVRVLVINLGPSEKSRVIVHLCILKLAMTARYLLQYRAPYSSFRLECAHLWGPSAGL